MENPEQNQMELDGADLAAIRELRKSVPFNHYFLRRVREKIQEAEAAILENGKVFGEELERQRIRRWTLLEVAGIMDDDYEAIAGNKRE